MAESGCPYIAGSADDYTRAQQRVDTLWAEHTPAQLTWKPGPERWSIAECVVHLSRTLDAHFPRLEKAIAKGRAKGRTGGQAPYGRGTFIGRVFLGFLDPARAKPKKFKAPQKFRASSAALDPQAVRAEFTERNDRLRALLQDAAGLDLGRVKVGAPPTALVRLSLAQGLQLHRWHHHRHLDQADRVTRETHFPGAEA